MTRLLIVSHTPHYLRNGQTVGWGATVREIDHLSTLFHSVVHVAPLHDGSADESALPYESPRVRLVPVAPAGGATWTSKLGLFLQLRRYWNTIRRELKYADVVHVRCPANISMVALAVLATSNGSRRPWFKYAGNWRPDGPEPLSYRLQRWWIAKRWHSGLVTVNGSWPEQPPHVITFFNPCLTEAELQTGSEAAAGKILEPPVRLLFVGRVDEAKGAGRLIEIGRRLMEVGVDCTLDLVGDGPNRAVFESTARAAGIEHRIRFHGWLPRASLESFYRQAHFLVLPSRTEGWPKVLSEGMAYGVVPIASQVGAIPQTLAQFGIGCCLHSHDVAGFSQDIVGYCSAPERWQRESQAAVRAAQNFSYANYLAAVRSLLALDDSSGRASEPAICGARRFS